MCYKGELNQPQSKMILNHLQLSKPSTIRWVQNLQNFKWEEEDVNRKLDRKMTDAFKAIWAIHEEHKVPLRTAAFMLALRRVTRAELHRGFD